MTRRLRRSRTDQLTPLAHQVKATSRVLGPAVPGAWQRSQQLIPGVNELHVLSPKFMCELAVLLGSLPAYRCFQSSTALPQVDLFDRWAGAVPSDVVRAEWRYR